MKRGLFLAFLCGTLAYIISVLIGLVLHYPLARILFSSLKYFFYLFIAITTFTGLIHLLASDDSGGEKADSSSPQGEKADKGQFAPLNPPVLQVEQEEDK